MRHEPEGADTYLKSDQRPRGDRRGSHYATPEVSGESHATPKIDASIQFVRRQCDPTQAKAIRKIGDPFNRTSLSAAERDPYDGRDSMLENVPEVS